VRVPCPLTYFEAIDVASKFREEFNNGEEKSRGAFDGDPDLDVVAHFT
jgi:hypothetical protein